MSEVPSAALLLVEPDRLARDLAVLALAGAGAGYQVVSAGDGVEALALIQTRRFDLLLVNLLLPRLNGFDVIRQARRVLGPEVPILVVTALSLRELVEQAIAAGANDFIVKPFDPQLLTAKVQGALARVRPAAQPQSAFGRRASATAAA